jgi:hypothetical protein
MKQTIKRILVAMPSILISAISYFPNIEKLHYGFDFPGISTDAALIITLCSILAIVLAAVALFFKHDEKQDFILPYLLIGLSVIRIYKVILTYETYYMLEHYST